MLAFAVSMGAQCAAAAEMTAAQHACCASIGHDCGASGQQHGCCTEAPRVDQSSASKRMAIAVPQTPVTVLAFVPGVPHAWDVTRVHAFDGFEPRLRGIPTFLLASSLRI